MKIAVPKERRAGEARVAASPDTVKKYVARGLEVVVEAGAGAGAAIADQAFADAGATIAADAAATLGAGDVVLKIQRPLTADDEGELDEVALMREGAVLIGLLDPTHAGAAAKRYAERRLTAFALELMPRISRAQAMDVLSSQSNLAGYKAAVDAASTFRRVFPLMMTAAGTVPPARVLVLGAGVAGLQAIATARRLGAVVSATDVRRAAREEVESLGATFVEVETEETGEAEGGYAREMSEDYKRRQAALVRETLAKSDIAITTALIQGRKAPTLISADMVAEMKPGSVIVDLAIDGGGNCELSEYDAVVEKHGVTIIARANVPSLIAPATAPLFARNVLNFVNLIVDDAGALAIDWDDEIVAAMALTRDGDIVHPLLTG